MFHRMSLLIFSILDEFNRIHQGLDRALLIFKHYPFQEIDQKIISSSDDNQTPQVIGGNYEMA